MQVLDLTACGLSDLDGLAAMPHLRELYAAYNGITDLDVLVDAERLEVLDIQANCVSSLDQVEWLTCLERLHVLLLAENAVSGRPGFSGLAAKLPCRQPLACSSDSKITQQVVPQRGWAHQQRLIRDSIAQRHIVHSQSADDVHVGRCVGLVCCPRLFDDKLGATVLETDVAQVFRLGNGHVQHDLASVPA